VACKYKGANAKDLHDHTIAVHAHQVVVDEEAEKEIVKKKRAS
jgi:hypothetical protein